MRIAESVGVYFTERRRVAVRRELVRHWNGVIAQALLAMRNGGAARIDAQNRADN